MNPTQTTATTCLLADDHPAILASVAAFLEDEGIDVTATAASATMISFFQALVLAAARGF